MKSFTCPNGCVVENKAGETPRCAKCKLVATWYNRVTGEVFTWTKSGAYAKSVRNLNDAMDAAFDNRYFNEV